MYRKKIDSEIDKILSSINTLVNLVEINKDEETGFSKERHEIRKKSIDDIYYILDKVNQLAGKIEDAADKTEKIHQNNNEKTISWIQKSMPRPEVRMIKETIGGIDLLARNVSSIDEVGTDLCYINQINRFAVRFAGIVLVGNVGSIYSSCANPERVKECHFASINYVPANNDRYYRTPQCSKTDGVCLFYHNPMIFPSSKEPRNFFATCGHYASADDQNHKNSNYMRYGNRNTLKEDLGRLTDEEKRRFEDYVTHLLLCLIILKRSHIY